MDDKKRSPLQQWVDCDIEEDDTVTFYSREFGGKRVVIIPKNRFKLDETETTFVLTFITEIG